MRDIYEHEEALDKWHISLCCLAGQEGRTFVYYKTVETLAEKLDMPSPYRNPDRTFASLIVFIARHCGK